MPLPGALGCCVWWGVFEGTQQRWEGPGGWCPVNACPSRPHRAPTHPWLPGQDRGAECPPLGPWAGTFLPGDEVRQGWPPTSPSPAPPWQGQAGHLWVSNVGAAAEAREGSLASSWLPTPPRPSGPGSRPLTPTLGRRRDPLWPWLQTSGFPSARGRPAWEAPTPGRGFPGALREFGGAARPV